MHRLPGVVALVVIGWLVGAPEARACSCAREPSDRVALQKARAGARALFRGRVEEIQGGPDAARPSPYRVTFAVTETFKGPPVARRVVTTEAFGVACGYPFEKGRDYLVYAGGDETRGWSTDSCSRTRPVERAAAELTFLRGGASPFVPLPKGGCTRCDLEATARLLVCPGAGPCAPLSRNEAEAALAGGRPFWTPGEARPAPERPRVFGVDPAGRAFRLTLQRPSDEDAPCTHRVVRHACERLVPARSGEKGDWDCRGGHAEDSLCDERATRPLPR